MNRADQILVAFSNFHRANPEIYNAFKEYTLHVISTGRKGYSAKAIIERIRWNLEVERRGEDVKINNNFTAYYARLFHAEFPAQDGFFKLRHRISQEAPASNNDQQFFDSGDPGEELALKGYLYNLLKETRHV